MDLTGLRSARHQAALTQRELGELAGVSQPTIIGIEHGRRKARPSTARKLARALGVTPAALMTPPNVDGGFGGQLVGGRQRSNYPADPGFDTRPVRVMDEETAR